MKLELKYPLTKISINQLFGQNATDYYVKANMLGHSGIDYFAPHGTPIYASHDGWAQYQVDNAGGHGVIIVTDKEYADEKGKLSFWKSIYWHMIDPLLEPTYASPIANKTGFTAIKTGEVIGYANNTGLSTGHHLHFGLKPVAGNFGMWFNLEQNNGYFGAVNPKPYMPDNGFIKEFTKWIKRGDENEEVIKLQAFLLRNGYMQPILKGFGYYGPATQRAVKQFQINNGIAHNNGVQVGPKTINKLNELYC